MTAPSGLAALSRRASADNTQERSVPPPPFRWRTRVLLPVLVLGALLALLAWAARDALWPAVEVRVVPVVARPRGGGPEPVVGDASGGAQGAPRERTLVQAPGWVEPAPFAVVVPALTDGVVAEVLALEGQRVDAGQVVARLVDTDARLALRRAEAELAERDAAAARARADLEAAAARAAVLRDELERKRPLAADGSVSAADLARLTHQLRAMEADAASASAALAAAEAARATQQVAVEQAALALSRTEIRTPAAGVVLSRSIEPGTRLAMTSPGPGEAHESGVMRVYDPASLQARVDVPLADAARVQIGAAARILSEALPDRPFVGTVTRAVHEANIQRNTVQFKVSIENPEPALKPEMLVRVRILGAGEPGTTAGAESADAGLVLLLPESVLSDPREGSAAAWFVERDARGRAVAARRALALGPRHDGGYVEIVAGAGPTDRAIADPPASLRQGARVRVTGEAESAKEDAR